MGVESLGQRPIFASEETEYLIPAKPPISRLAIASLVLGLVSGLAVLDIDLIALPILAVAIGLAAYWQISRSDTVRGRTLALIGLGLGVGFAIWSVTAVRLRDQYLYAVSSQFAEHYLEVIGENRLLEAFELMQEETARQVSGTSLEEHYNQAGIAEETALATFRTDPKTKAIVDRGPGADWQLQRGLRVDDPQHGFRRIAVRMVDASRSPGIEVDVVLARTRNAGDDGTGSASWFVVDLN